MTQILSTLKGDIAVRKATPHDATQVYDLRLDALSRHPEAFAADIDITIANGVSEWDRLIENYDKLQSGTLVIASAGDELIGMTGVYRGHWPKTRHSGGVWGVYVKPEWRGLQIAGAILNECIAWAREHGVVVLKLGVVTSNEPAIRCYTRCGFTIYGTEPKSNFYDGVFYDEFLMGKLI